MLTEAEFQTNNLCITKL